MDGIKPHSGLSPIYPSDHATRTGPAALPEDVALEEDQLDVHSRGRARPRIVLQVVADRVEEVGGFKVQTELVEEREELDGETLKSSFHQVRTQLEALPDQAAAAHSGLDASRIRQLLAD